jgi:hypothetical protein
MGIGGRRPPPHREQHDAARKLTKPAQLRWALPRSGGWGQTKTPNGGLWRPISRMQDRSHGRRASAAPLGAMMPEAARGKNDCRWQGQPKYQADWSRGSTGPPTPMRTNTIVEDAAYPAMMAYRWSGDQVPPAFSVRDGATVSVADAPAGLVRFDGPNGPSDAPGPPLSLE